MLTLSLVRRVLLKATDDNAVVVAERVLIQPYSMLVNVERNLCSWYTLIPTISMGAQLGTFKVENILLDIIILKVININICTCIS